LAQEYHALISGTVTDPSGAAVPDASVSVRNVKTNMVVKIQTGSSGNYGIAQLPTGSYELTVEAKGFQTYKRQGITLSVGDRASVNVTLQVGQRSDSMTVTADLGAGEANQSVMGLVTDSKVLAETPLQGRQIYQLLTLTAGVVQSYVGPDTRDTGWSFNGDYSIHGSYPNANLFMMDGNMMGGKGSWTMAPLVDAVEEFKIASPVTDSSYGLSGGGVVNITMKAGNNELHGTVSEFLRNAVMDANRTELNRALATSPYLKKQNTWNMFSARVGGPIIKNKLFYSGYYDGNRIRDGEGGGGNAVTVPTVPQRAGDFSQTFNADGNLMVIYDPLTTVPSADGWYTRQPFLNNIIPENRIVEPARHILNSIPLPNLVTNPLTNVSNYISIPNAARISLNNYFAKFDYLWNNHHRTSLSQTYSWDENIESGNGFWGSPAVDGNIQRRYHNAATIDHVWDAGAGYTLNIRVAWDHWNSNVTPDFQMNTDVSEWGFTGQIGASPVNHFPLVELADYATIGNGYFVYDPGDTLALHVDAAKQVNRHFLRFGGLAVDYRFGFIEHNFTYGHYWFDRNFTLQQPEYFDTDSGNTIASVLLGAPAGASTIIPSSANFAHKVFGLYLQDDIKLTPRLNVNLGLRWDLQTPPTERHNRQVLNFDPNLTYPLGPGEAKGGFIFASPQKRQVWDKHYHDLQPRLGVAYRIANWITWRSGYGISYIPISGGDGQGGGVIQTGFNQETDMVISMGPDEKWYIPRQPGTGTLENPFPKGLLLPLGDSLGPKSFLGTWPQYVARDYLIPRVHQFFAGLSLDLPWRTKAEVSYVGSRTHHLPLQSGINVNAIPLSIRQEAAKDPHYWEGEVTNPWYPDLALQGTFLDNSTLSKEQMAKPFPQFDGVINMGASQGWNSYDSLELRIQRQMTGGSELRLDYTLSKTLQALNWTEEDFQLHQVLAPWDRTHNLNVIALWQLPVGRGKAVGRNWNRPLDLALGGWQFNGTFSYMNGIPTPFGWNVVPVRDPRLPSQSIQRWFNTCTLYVDGTRGGCTSPDEPVAWRQPNQNEVYVNPLVFPNIRNHWQPQVNISIFKDFAITERWRFTFRAETFNLTNTPIYDQPIVDSTDPNFGVVLPNQINRARNIQLALQLQF
jgi:hypothetical protein